MPNLQQGCLQRLRHLSMHPRQAWHPRAQFVQHITQGTQPMMQLQQAQVRSQPVWQQDVQGPQLQVGFGHRMPPQKGMQHGAQQILQFSKTGQSQAQHL
mmetsp:Transcript_79050/g.164193  ORF Transcript_79050/g.164193 Transcript_79050/m.164193 type:complete len:99 (+) Transcript_79050:699-995(+)